MDGYSGDVTLLPIAVRELRVSARTKSTHWIRLVFAGLALFIAGALGLFSSMSGGFLNSQLGIAVFATIKWIAFALAAAAGVFLTADCLSEEKREGTLGLLFLTDLRGYDVVLGKLLATSLRSFYGLLAIFPVMAFCFILGGISSQEFQHTVVSLCNGLFFSLALGMAVSAACRAPHKAITITLVAAVAFLFLLPALDSIPSIKKSGVPRFALVSSWFAFNQASSFRPRDFWTSILIVQVASWCLLALASWMTPRSWQEKGFRQNPLFRFFGDTAASRRLRDRSPVCWIISRDRWGATVAGIAVAAALVCLSLSVVAYFHLSTVTPQAFTPPAPATNSVTYTNGSTTTYVYANTASATVSSGWYILASGCSSVLSFGLELWLVLQVARFYIEGRKNGFLELLWVTPVKSKEIVEGHWQALRRQFLPPIAAQFLLMLACGFLQILATQTTFAAAAPGSKSAGFGANDYRTVELVSLVLGALNWFLGLASLAWFGIWMGLTSKNISMAMVKVFCFVKVGPWMAVSFLSGLLAIVFFQFSKGSTGPAAIWIFPALLQGIFLAVNIFLISLARHESRGLIAKWPERI